MTENQMNEHQYDFVNRTVRENKESLKSEFPSSKEKIDYLKRYILKGGKLIRDKKYKEAIDYFENKQVAQKVGFQYGDRAETTCAFLSKTPSLEAIPHIADGVASLSWFENMHGEKKIILSTVIPYPNNTNDSPTIIPESLYHEVSLIHVEEWLHGLQYLQHKPMTGLFSSEIDIAIYMFKHKIPMTDTFLRRYDRVSFINRLKNESFIPRIKNFTNISHLMKKILKKEEK